MGDAHHVIIHHRGQMIKSPPVGLQNNGIFQLTVIDGNITAQHVMYHRRPFMRNLQPNHMRFTRGNPAFGLIQRDIAAVPVIMRKFIIFSLLFAHLFQTFRRAETIVCRAHFNQLFGHFLIDFFPLCLTIRAVRAAYIRTLIPLDPQPVQTVNDFLLRSRDITCAVRIFNTQNKLAAGLFGDQVIIQSRPGTAQMQPSCR